MGSGAEEMKAGSSRVQRMSDGEDRVVREVVREAFGEGEFSWAASGAKLVERLQRQLTALE